VAVSLAPHRAPVALLLANAIVWFAIAQGWP
jgi:hypothetical protein